jgi:hypothetical protein
MGTSMGLVRRSAPHRHSDSLKIDGRRLALLPALEVKGYLLTLIEAGQTGPFHCGNVNEDVLRSVVGLDESIALLAVKPFNGAF